MTEIDQVLDNARDVAADFLNADGRSASHVTLGIVVTAGFALFATALATGAISPERRTRLSAARGEGAVTERPRGAFSLVLPAVFSATTLSALRVWNAPAAPERTTAMRLWALAQGVNAVWLAAQPRSRTTQILAAMTSAGLAAAFAFEARKLDPEAGKLAAPTGAGVRVSNFVERKAKGEARQTA